MGRVYTVTFANVAATAVQDLFTIPSGSTQVIKILSAFIGQSSDEGDAQAELLRIRVRRASGAYTQGSGGSTPTANPHRFSDTAFAGGTVHANDTTQGSGGTITTIFEETFNVQAGWYYTPTPEEVFVLSGSQFFILDLPGAPTDELTISGRVTFDVEGGA